MDRATRRILEGPLAWELFRFGLPLAIGMALQNAFNLIDAYLIAQLPSNEVAAAVGAVGVCDQIAAVGTIVCFGVTTATATLLSTQHGAGDHEGVKRTAWQSLIITAALSLLFGVGGFAANFIAHDLIGLKGAVAEIATRYLRIILPGSFSIFFLLQMTSIQRALGSAKTPVLLLVLSNLINLVFAVVCLYGTEPPNAKLAWGAGVAASLGIPRMGMVGAAWATVTARTLALVPIAILLVTRFRLKPTGGLGPDMREIKRILKLAWPSSTQFVLRIGAMLLVNSLVARFYSTAEDQTATTAMGLVFRVDTMALFVAMGWGSAAQTFVGQNLGAGGRARAIRAGWLTSVYDFGTNVVLCALLFFFAPKVLRFFGKDEGAVLVGLDYLRVVAPSYLALGFAIVLGNAIVGAGATKTTLKLDALILLAVQVPLCLVATGVLHGSITMLFGCVAVTSVIGAILYAFVYSRGRWRERTSPISSPTPLES